MLKAHIAQKPLYRKKREGKRETIKGGEDVSTRHLAPKMNSELLSDERFLRIQKLNSNNNGDKRKSITLPNDEDAAYGSDVELLSGSEVLEKVRSLAAATGTLKDDSAIVVGDTNEEADSTVVLEPAASPNGLAGEESVTSTTTISGGTASGAEDASDFNLHVKSLYVKEKKRYKKKSKQAISYFGDVNFTKRPSILDGSLNVPFRSSFNGPTLEKQFKALENPKSKIFNSDQTEQYIVQSTDLHPDFSGIYVLFWMTVAFSAVKVLVEYYYEHNYSFRDSEILKTMTSDWFAVASIDLYMYLATYFVFFIQWLCKRKIIKWEREGWIITSIYEVAFIIFFMVLTENVMKLHWIAKIFLFLHSLVLAMKMHSFAFFNGYLWNILSELNFSKAALAKYKDASKEIVEVLEKSRDFCRAELESQSSATEKFPENIKIQKYFMYTMFPTLVYQLEYPRTNKIRWLYVLEKICAIFGTIFVMMLVAQTYMYPVAMRAIAVRETEFTGILGRMRQWSLLFVDIVPSFIVMYLLVFYLIWDAILNCIAELTMFGDRYFYGDWWNCVSWADFSRIWNVPVHKFLLRHVYHSSISFLNLSKSQATLVTFFLSSVVHELAMYVLFKKLRFYLFFLQMFQLPLVSISNSRYLKNKPIIGNIMFWIGICTGPSIMCTLYLTF